MCYIQMSYAEINVCCILTLTDIIWEIEIITVVAMLKSFGIGTGSELEFKAGVGHTGSVWIVESQDAPVDHRW